MLTPWLGAMGIPLATSHTGINLDQDYLHGVSSLFI
jgi:hypothetical protein